MKNLITITLLFLISYNYSQNIEKIELSQEDFEYLSQDLNRPFGDFDKYYEESLKNNMTIYAYEIVYDNKVISRGTIEKPSASLPLSASTKKIHLLFNLNKFDADTQLELAVNYSRGVKTSSNGEKYLLIKDFLFIKNKRGGGFDINDKIAEKISVKFYKYVESE